MKKELIEPYGFIYITTNMVNGKRYIGQKKFDDKWENYLGSGAIFIKALNKYGKENFHRDIVAIAYSKEELDYLEIEWINNLNAVYSEDYYNIATGGHNGNTYAGKTEEEMLEIRKKMSEQRQGENNSNSKSIVCLNTKEIFTTLKKAGEFYDFNSTNISHTFKNKNRKSAGKHPVTGENLVWRLYEDYVKMSEEEIKQAIEEANVIIRTNSTKVICLNTKMIFNTQREASNYYKCDQGEISKCCRGKRKSCGKHPTTKEPLKWMYYEEYLKLNKAS